MVIPCASIHLAYGGTGFTLNPGTNTFNYYAYNGTTLTSDGIDPVAPFSGSSVPPSFLQNYRPTSFQGMIPAVGHQTVTSTVIIGGGSGAYAQFILGSASLAAGANPTGDSSSGVSDLTLYLNNPDPAADEVRFDWIANYTYSGTSPTTLGSPSSPLFVITSGYLSSSGSYYALAGGETLTDGASSTTATIGAGTSPGDGFTTAGLGSGPWNGALASGTTYYINTPSAPFSPGGLTVNHGDIVAVQGYLDLVVDPGYIQVQLMLIPPPLLGITTYSNFPVVFFPTTPGTNFILQTTTNLSTGNWVPVTNGIPISGFIITNSTSPAFFQLN